MAEILDDKAQHVVPFVLELLQQHQQRHTPNSGQDYPPFFIGLNGVQGAGKTVLVSILKSTLESPPHNLPTVVFSLDDLYLSHADQIDLAKSNPNNPLLQHRGQPSTHDVPLALDVFKALKQSEKTRIPQYNKAAFNGTGDRVPEAEWETVNDSSNHAIRVVIFEGWCVGFRPLSSSSLKSEWESACAAAEAPDSNYSGRLSYNSLTSITTINDALRQYDEITDQLDAFVHIDAADPLYVYVWRQEQEHSLWQKKGSGMSDAEVKNFIDGYYPAYELYTETLREGVFRGQGQDRQGRQMRLVVGDDRKVREVIKI